MANESHQPPPEGQVGRPNAGPEEAKSRGGCLFSLLVGAAFFFLLRDFTATPVAVVTDASRAAQSVWDGPLEALGAQPVPSPSVLVIGEVSGADDRSVLGELPDRHPAWR